MNASGLGLATLFLVLLLVVVFGVQQVDTTQQDEFQKLMQQRDQAVLLAQEAKAQRDDKANEAALLRGQLGDMKAGLQTQEADLAAKNAQLAEATKIANERAARIQSLEAEKATLQQQVQVEVGRVKEMDKLILAMNGQLAMIPVTSPDGQGTGQAAQNSVDCQSQKVSTDGIGDLFGFGLLALIGMVALGGGFVLYQGKKHMAG